MAALRNLRAAVLRKDKNVDGTRMMFIRTSDCSLTRQKEDWNTEKAVRSYAGKSPIFRSVSRNGKQVEEIAAWRENSLRYVVVQVPGIHVSAKISPILSFTFLVSFDLD